MDDRPGTSFTLKRHFKTDQRRKLTEDPTLRTTSRPTTQHKRIPMAIAQDKETLYELVISLKQQINALQNENQALTVKCKNQEQQLTKLLRQSDVNPFDRYYRESPDKPMTLVVDLKRELRKSWMTIQQKEEQLHSISKQSKTLKVKELEQDVLALQNETIRLKHLIQVSPERAEEIENDEKQRVLSIRCREHESKAKKLQIDCLKKEKVIQFLKDEVTKLKMREPEIKKPQRISDAEEMLRCDLMERDHRLEVLQMHLKSKDQALQDMERRINALERENSIKVDNLEREKQSLKDQLKQSREEALKRRGTSQVSFMQSVNEDDNEEEITIRKPRITKDDITTEIDSIRYRLRAAQLHIDSILLFQRSEILSIEELVNGFILQPFFLTEDQALKVARFLVEDDSERYVQFSIKCAESTPRIKSILKTILGPYQLLSPLQKDEYMQQWEFIRDNNLNAIQQFLPKYTNKCSRQQLQQALQNADVHISPQLFDYLILWNLDQTNNIKDIDLGLILGNPSLKRNLSKIPISMNDISSESSIQEFTTPKPIKIQITEPQIDEQFDEQDPDHLAEQNKNHEQEDSYYYPSNIDIVESHSQSIQFQSINALE